ncbi:MAG: NAD(P)-binding domain-containing protein [Candidatus Wallbacteria bacterium]|nr:NAD(P)-binding domain-containing protein [Candidatus Wallbacteria bacterium]
MHFRKIAVVGGGTMGQGIAQVAASAGIDVVLVEVSEERAQQVQRELSAKLDAQIAKWGLTTSDKRAILARVHVTEDKAHFGHVDLAVEAVPERLAVKQAVFVDLERILGPDVVKITHTATLSVSEISQVLQHPERAIGMHFLSPVHRVPVVEVVRGLATSDDTFGTVKQLIAVLGKTCVEVNEYPGYITTRGIVPMLNEAMHMVMEGVASARDVDAALKLGFGLEMGPLGMADRIGLDQVLLWMESLFHELGEMKYRPCPLLRKMVLAGHLGIKSGKGFFVYSDPAGSGQPSAAPGTP